MEKAEALIGERQGLGGEEGVRRRLGRGLGGSRKDCVR